MPAREAELGRALARDILRRRRPANNPAARVYASRLAHTLLAFLPAPQAMEPVVEIIQGDGLPLPAPGGYLFIPEGLFAVAEPDFAAAIAHALAHIAAGHGLPAPSTSLVVPPCTRAAGAVMPRALLRTAEVNEADADRMAAAALAAAGTPAGSAEYEALRRRR